MTIPELYRLYEQYPSVQTDTRKLKPGDIFFALKGPSFNGNKFAMQALEQGAAYAVVDEPAGDDKRLIKVDNTLLVLQALAQHHREQFSIPFIAITGSNGKTTSKELVSAVLSAHFITYTTEGNLNNHIGVPLTLLRIRKDAQMAVIEMGANHQKEIEGYCSYTQPTHGIITNIGKAHLEGFGGEAGVKKGKGELFDYLRAHNGTAFVFADYDYFNDMLPGIETVVQYGTKNGIVQGEIEAADPYLRVRMKTSGEVHAYVLQSQLVGDYNLPNILCAVTVGRHFGVPEEKIRLAIEQYAPSNSRSQMVEKDSNHIILDAYNANPSSMRVAIENFARLEASEKILLLGGMMELGESSIAEHRQLVSLIQQFSWKEVVLVGGDFGRFEHGMRYFPTAAEAGDWFAAQRFSNSYILIKGSRSMQMEKILER